MSPAEAEIAQMAEDLKKIRGRRVRRFRHRVEDEFYANLPNIDLTGNFF